VAHEPAQADLQRTRDAITERTLGLVDRQIGRGEPPSPAEWQELRDLAGGHEESLRLVGELQSVVERFDAQLRARFAAAGETVDLARLREGLATLIREIVRKKAPAASAGAQTH
jgi:hypothetical protein